MADDEGAARVARGGALEGFVEIDTREPVWERFFVVAPLVLVGSKEPDGSYDLAPKHMAIPIGWQNYYGFVCAPRHATHRNIAREGEFTVSFLRPDQLIEASMAAAPRDEAGAKATLRALPTTPAQQVDGALVEGCDLYLECRLERIVEGFGENSLIVGTIVRALARAEAVRSPDRDDADVIYGAPLTAYLAPGRVARIAESFSFPYPVDFTL